VPRVQTGLSQTVLTDLLHSCPVSSIGLVLLTPCGRPIKEHQNCHRNQTAEVFFSETERSLPNTFASIENSLPPWAKESLLPGRSSVRGNEMITPPWATTVEAVQWVEAGVPRRRKCEVQSSDRCEKGRECYALFAFANFRKVESVPFSLNVQKLSVSGLVGGEASPL